MMINLTEMGLYNHSPLPDDVLRALVEEAADRVGADTTRVPVYVSGRPQNKHLHGYVSWDHSVNEEFLIGGRWREREPRWIDLSKAGGWICLYLGLGGMSPRADLGRYSLSVAERLWEMCLHEWTHIADNQTPEGIDRSRPGSSGRRPRWQDRPEEHRANLAAARALGCPLVKDRLPSQSAAFEPYYDEAATELILDLAVALEAIVEQRSQE